MFLKIIDRNNLTDVNDGNNILYVNFTGQWKSSGENQFKKHFNQSSGRIEINFLHDYRAEKDYVQLAMFNGELYDNKIAIGQIEYNFIKDKSEIKVDFQK